MTDSTVIQIATESIILAGKLCGPILAISLAIGLGIGLIQSATQIQEQTLTFVPKLAGVALVIVIAGNWMLTQMLTFTHSLFSMVPQLISG